MRDLISQFVLTLLLVIALPANGQAVIKGTINSPSGTPLPGVSLLVKDTQQKIKAYAISDTNGGYLLQVKEPGNYTLEVNFLGYEKQSLNLAVVAGKNITQNFTLTESGAELKEVIINYEAPVKLRGDTLVFDAKALSTGTEVVVEDLLKRIPGITIMPDGTIKYGDRIIEKVMVDGDDLFNRGYSLLTKNMPSQPLDKIEVLQNYSNNKLLKGIEDSDKVALNLTLDDEYKSVWFGNLTAGAGNDSRYKANGNLMNFGKEYKNFLSVAGNNDGYDNVGSLTGMFYGSTDIESTGGGTNAAQVMNLSYSVPRLDENRTRFNNSQMAALSSILPLGKKIKLKLRGFLGFDELKGYQDFYSVTDVEGTYFENSQSNRSKNEVSKGYISAYINYDVSATKMLQAMTTYNAGSANFTNNLTFNGTSTKEQLETKTTYFDQKLTYTHKWKERNVVLLKGRFFTNRLPQEYGINEYLMGSLFPYDDINALGNAINSSKQYAGLQADFKLKQKNSDLIEFSVGFEDDYDELSTRFSLFTDSGIVNPEDFQSNSSMNVGDLYARSGYTFKFRHFSVGARVNVHQLFNTFDNKEGNRKHQNPFFINPGVFATWEVKPDNTLSASYDYNVTNSGLLQVNDAYLLTSSRSFSKGLGDFNQLESSNARLNFLTKHYLNRYSFGVGLTYGTQNDVLSYRSQLEQNSSLTEAFVMKGGDRIGASVTTHYVVRRLKGTVRLEARGEQAVYYNQVNGSGLRKNTRYTQNYIFRWSSSFESAFNFNVGTDWSFFKVESDNTFTNSTKVSFLDLMYAYNEHFNAKVKTEHYNFGGLDKNNNYFFTDLEATYSFKKDKYAIVLEGKNLFDTNTFTTYSVSDTGYTTNSYRLLPRYIIASFRFRF